MDLKPTKDYIVFKLHNPCGLFNQVSCLENAIAISHFLKKDIFIHHVFNRAGWTTELPHGVGVYSANRWFNNRPSLIDETRIPKISDLMNVDPYNTLTFIDEELEIEARLFNDNFFNFSDNINNELDFGVGRHKFIDSEWNHYSFTWTLGWYSVLFMNRTAEVDTALFNTRFKQEYYDLAKDISKSLGDFVGAHLRFTDHKFDSPTDLEIKLGLDSLKSGYTKVITTDEPAHSSVWPLEERGDILILEKYIEKEFHKEFKDLPFNDEVTLGLVCNLVMHDSKDFIGTQGSTYTGYIQRHVGGNMKLFAESPYTQTGVFTWNGYKYPQLKNQTLNKRIGYKYELREWDNFWWREWPESKLFPKLV